jgi:hypothetical protein
MFKASLPLAVAAAALLSGLSGAEAQTVMALVDGKSLATIDLAQKKVMRSVTLDGGATLVGIDVRPADGRLYGLAGDGTIVIVDAKTGKWEKKSQLSEKLATGVTYTVDFNPVADRLRVIASNGTNLRINVDDGKTTVDAPLKFADADAAKLQTGRVVAGGYVNSFAGTKETALYDVDATTNSLVKQAPPNDGILNTVGSLGIKLGTSVAFDILADGKGGNAAWLMSDDSLFTVDLATGKATAAGKIGGLKGKVTDMAVMAPSGASM